MRHRNRRSRIGRVLRPTFEMILLIASLVAGLGVVGSCVSAGTGTEAALSSALSTVVAVLLVGAVFLVTTMSRDLRRLRERYVDGDSSTRHQPSDSALGAAHTVSPPRVDVREEKP